MAPQGKAERSPQEIQADIEETRRELGDTAAALADKADVKKQAKRKASEVKAKVPSPPEIPETARRNPVPSAAAGGFAAGLLMGWMLGRR